MRFTAALLISIALHGVLAVGIALYIDLTSGAVAVATLDLSSVELSFAEDEADAPAAVASRAMPAPSAQSAPVPRAAEAPEPPPETPDAPPLPVPRPFEPPRPDAPREEMQTPERMPEEEKPEEKSVPAESPQTAESASAAPKQARVDAPPKPRRAIRPDYPMGARRRGEQGDVVLEIRVDETGAVANVAVAESCGFRELDEAAVRAARGARFTPAKSGQTPVASTARLTLSFRLK